MAGEYVDINLLPKDVQEAARFFVDMVREDGKTDMLSAEDFKATAEFLKRMAGAPTEYCEAFERLRNYAGLGRDSRCDLLGDADKVMAGIKEQLAWKNRSPECLDKSQWNELDKFASLEYLGRILLTFSASFENGTIGMDPYSHFAKKRPTLNCAKCRTLFCRTLFNVPMFFSFQPYMKGCR
jgi:hypothetical protein